MPAKTGYAMFQYGYATFQFVLFRRNDGGNVVYKIRSLPYTGQKTLQILFLVQGVE